MFSTDQNKLKNSNPGNDYTIITAESVCGAWNWSNDPRTAVKEV